MTSVRGIADASVTSDAKGLANSVMCAAVPTAMRSSFRVPATGPRIDDVHLRTDEIAIPVSG